MQTLGQALNMPTPEETPSQGTGELIPSDLYDPESKRNILRDHLPEKFRDPRQPTRVEYADSSNSVPLPERAAPAAVQNLDNTADPNVPPMPERGDRSTTFIPPGTPLVQQNDSRYNDYSQLIVADVVLGGMLPWLQAATDVATGRVPVEQFDAVRQEHEERIEGLKSEHSGLVKSAENAMPFLGGLGLGIMKPAASAMGTVGRGVAMGGAQGAVQGFTSGDPAQSSLSSERVGRAVGGAAEGAVLGAAGAAGPAVKQSSDAAKATAQAAQRSAAQQAKLDEAKRAAQQKRQMAAEEKQRTTEMLGRYKSYSTKPATPTTHWKENRKTLIADPEVAFRKQAIIEPTIESFAKNVNMSPVAIAQRFVGTNIQPSNPREKRLAEQLRDVDASWQAYNRNGRTGEEAPPAATPTQGQADAPKRNPFSDYAAGAKSGSEPAPTKLAADPATPNPRTDSVAGRVSTSSKPGPGFTKSTVGPKPAGPAAKPAAKPRKPRDPNKLVVQPRQPVRKSTRKPRKS